MLSSHALTVDTNEVLCDTELNTFENLNRHVLGNDTLSSTTDAAAATNIINAYITKFTSVSRYSWSVDDHDDQRALSTLLKDVSAQGGNGPCNFPPITLSWSAILQLFNAYNATACHK
jgi:hypothetical protein